MRLFRALYSSLGSSSTTQKWMFELEGYCRLGLLKDDLLHETPEVKEAIRRLPEDLQMERVFRLKRAHQLHTGHALLPKDQWTKKEEDIKYLSPYVDEVNAEIREKENWGKK